MPSFTEQMVATTASLYGKLDCAVNCTGTVGPPALSHEVDIGEHDRVINIKCRETFLSSRAELEAMVGNEPSSISQAFGAWLVLEDSVSVTFNL